MAGLGFKDFAVGEVLTSSDVDGYLMQQTVMRFADAGARGSALGTATGAGTALAEGMVAYLQDVDEVQFYDGTSWGLVGPVGIGSNVVQTVKTDTFTVASSTFTDITDFSATITPSSASSKILVQAYFAISNSEANADVSSGVHARLLRDSTVLFVGDSSSSRVQTTAGFTGGIIRLAVIASPIFLDSPNTTSATTYKFQLRNGLGGTATFGRTGQDTDNANAPRMPASLTLIEVKA